MHGKFTHPRFQKVVRLTVVALMVAAAIPPARILILRGSEIVESEPTELVAESIWPIAPEWPALPSGWRIEAHRRPPEIILPVRWNRDFSDQTNEQRWSNLERNVLGTILSGSAKLKELQETKQPLAGLAMLLEPESNVAPDERNPWRVVLFTSLDSSGIDQALQNYADGRFPDQFDLAETRATPIFCDFTQNTVWAVAATNRDGIAQAWDWAIESNRLKMEFSGRIQNAATQEEIDKIKGEIEAMRAEGYEL